MTADRVPPSHIVLLADDDVFECGYVEAVLAARGIAVVGSSIAEEPVLATIEGQALSAAVVTHPSEPQMLDALGRQGIPYLVLARQADIPVDPNRPVLVRPFAAYQVADWVLTVLADQRPTPGK